MIKRILFLVVLMGSSVGLSCYSDFDCGYGNKCVKPSGSINLNGTCVTPSDQFGNATPNYNPPNSQPNVIRGCSWDTDCAIGFSCFKRSGELKGICVR